MFCIRAVYNYKVFDNNTIMEQVISINFPFTPSKSNRTSPFYKNGKRQTPRREQTTRIIPHNEPPFEILSGRKIK